MSLLERSYIICRNNTTNNKELYEYGFGENMRKSQLFNGSKIKLIDFYHGVVIVDNKGRLYYKWHCTGDIKLMRMSGFKNVTKISCGGAHLLLLTNNNHLYEISDFGVSKDEWRIKWNSKEKIVDICTGNYYSIVLGSSNKIYVYKCGSLESVQKTNLELTSISCMFDDEHDSDIYAIDKNSGYYRFIDILDEDEFSSIHFLKNDKIISLKCGNTHAVLLTESNDVYTFGNICRGQLGTIDCSPFNNETFKTKGYYPFIIEPQLVTELKHLAIYKIIAKGDYVLVITNDGVYGWGSNEFDHLGKKKDRVITLPIKIEMFDDKTFDCDHFKQTKSARSIENVGVNKAV